MADSHSHSFWVLGALLGGPNVAIGICSLSLWLIFTPTPVGHWRLFVPWFALSHATISFTHLSHADRSQPVLFSHQVITLHQDWTWLGLCAMVCFIPSPPTISFTHLFHTDRSASASLASSP